MIDLLNFITKIINKSHDMIIDFVNTQGYNFTDKQLHFVVMALVGFSIFVFTQILFKILSKFSITAISFIYTFTVLIVIVFAIEVQQKLTGRGSMEFADISYGLYGFLSVFIAYLLLRGLLWTIKNLLKKAWNGIKTLSWKDF